MKPRSRIYITQPVPQEALDVLLENCNVSFWNSIEPVPRGELLNNVPGVHALLCMPHNKIDRIVLDRAGSSLKVIGTLSEQFDHIDVKECTRRNIQVVTMTSLSSEIVADLTVSVLQKVLLATEQDANANQRVNKNDTLVEIFQRKTLGIIGLGRTGVAVCKSLRAEGISKIKYHDITKKTSEETMTGATYEEFNKILEESDIICVSCKQTSANMELINRNAFSKMKKSAILIDASRGHVINYFDLYEALRERKIFMAAVDLREQGNILFKDQLLGLNNCIFLPYQESDRWDKRSKTSAGVANKIMAVLQNGSVPTTCPVWG